MRRLFIELLLFGGVIQVLKYVDLAVLLIASGVMFAAIICADLILASPSPR